MIVSPAWKAPVTVPNVIRVFPSPPRPVAPTTPSIAKSAKYVKQFNHSTLAPLVIIKPRLLGTINVHSLNNIAASKLARVTRLPSTYAPRPALLLKNP